MKQNEQVKDVDLGSNVVRRIGTEQVFLVESVYWKKMKGRLYVINV